MFTWREEDPSTRKILEGGSTLRWVYTCRDFGPYDAQVEKVREKKHHTRVFKVQKHLVTFIFVIFVMTYE